MPTFISGLPVHVLVIHAVVVLVPLAVLGAVAVVVRPAARRRHGVLVVALTALAAVFVPLATSSGEGLQQSLPRNPMIATHAALGDQLLPLVALLLAAVTALVVLDRYGQRQPADGPGTMAAPARRWRRPVGLLLSVAVLAAAAASAVQVVRIGDSGARAVWGGLAASASASADAGNR